MTRMIRAFWLLAVAAGTADAATLVTPALQIGESGRAVCTLLNTTDRDVPVARWELVFDDGRVLERFPGSTLRGGLALDIDDTPSGAGVGVGLWYCRAEIAGSSKKVRLAICALDPDGDCNAVATAP